MMFACDNISGGVNVQLPANKNPTPKRLALVHPGGVQDVIIVTKYVQVSGVGFQVSAKKFGLLELSRS